MLLTLLLVPALALASADGTPADLRLPLSSDALDAVLVVSGTPAEEARPARLLVADAGTNQPVSLGSAELSLSGPASVTGSFVGSAGVHEGRLLLPMEGDYAGSLVVDVGGKADLMSVTGLRVRLPAVQALPDASVTQTGALILAALLLFGAGYGLGRRRGAALVLLGIAALAGRQVQAHGGEDHGAAPAAVVAPGSSVVLPMESQFLLGLRTLRIYASSFAPRTLGLGALSAAPGGAATLRAPTAGSVEAPPAGFPAPGSVVKVGQLLALLREAPSSADRAALLGQQADAETRLATARANLRLAQRDLEQVDSLGPALTERERLERRNAVDVATVEVREAERAANGAGLLLPIHAPLSGYLAAEMARPGDTVEAGADLFHVVSNDTLWLRARVPEAQATRIERGSPAEVLLPSLPGRSFSAILLDGGLEADPLTGTVTVTLALAPDPALRSGLAATAWIAVGAPEDVLTVPDDAVVESNGSTLVFVKTGPERFEAREVSLGARSGKSWEVHAGLRPAERVVVAGTYALKSLAGR